MLGNSAKKLKYHTIHDFRSASDYLDYMFSGIQGVCYRATINPRYYQEYYRSSGLAKVDYDGMDNVYVSMNTFYREKNTDRQKGREVALLKRLNALYVDIDCYKVGLSKGEVLLRLEDDFYNTKIPVPTFTIDSGRGIYLIWKIRNEDRNALPRWNTIAQYLTDTLMELGADQACTDAARILRVPFSRNSKSHSAVTIEEFHDITYSLYEIAREYDIQPKKRKKTTKYPYNHATERQRKYVRDIAERLHLPKEGFPDFTNFHETDNWIKIHRNITTAKKEYAYKNGKVYSLSEYKSMQGILASYCKDIRTLFSLRKGADCKRELALFLYRYFLRERKYSSDEALKETLAFNASLDCPFEEDYVTTVTSSADRQIEKGIPYAYKKSTIIKILEVTQEEMEHLPFLSSRKDKQEKNRKEYRQRLAMCGKTLKKDALLQRRASILSLQEMGMSPSQIQRALHISRATYHRDIVALATESVLEAARAVLQEKSEEIMKRIKRAAEAVSDAIKSVRKHGFSVAVRDAVPQQKKSSISDMEHAMSHFFSPPIIDSTALAVPHSPVCSLDTAGGCLWLRFRRYLGHTGDDSGS